MTQMKEKDKQFVMNILGLDAPKLDELFSEILALPDEGEQSKERFVHNLCDNMRGRDKYELKKILLTRLS